MRKLKLLFTTAALLLAGGISVSAQIDVTSTYLTNADFEGTYTSYAQPKSDRDIYQPEGWAISYTNGNENDLTSLNSSTTSWSSFSGKSQPANGGSNTYWMRYRWGSSENITLSQETSANLPAGTYAVTVDAYSDDNTGTATISAAGVSQSIRSNGAWTNYTVVFTLASAQKVTVSLSYTNTAADDYVAAFDNVKILDLNSEPTGIALKNELGGTAATLSDFNVWYNDYTLEVEGTAGTEISVAADNITYTPEATGTVRFVKKDGIVYVFEGTAYKGAIHSSKADYTYSRTLSKDDPTTNNYLANPSFETTGANISGSKYKFGDPWTTNYSGSDIRIDKGTKSGIHGTCVLVWRGSGSGKDWYFSQQISLPKYKGVKVFLQQIDGGNANAKFNVGVGNAAGDYSYVSTQFTLGSGKNDIYNAELGYNESMATGNVYFSFRNTSTNTSSSGSDPVSQIDWIGLVGSNDFPITGVSSASYVYGTAYAPATAKSSYLAAKAEAETTIADATYDNVTGSERTALQAAIDADVDDNDAAYNTATDNIQTAQDAFTGALTHYQALIDAQAAVPDLAYASTEKKAFKTAVATSASDADAKVAAMTTNIRAYYESHALAEGVAFPINKTSLIVNPVNPTNTSGWKVTNTTGDCKMRIMSNEPYTNSDNTNASGYFDSNSWGAAFTSTFTQVVNLSAGKYLLTIKARGNGTTTYQVTAGGESTDITTSGSSGGVFARGWNDFSVEFTVASAGDVTIGVNMETGASSNWLSFGDFRLVRIDATAAEASDYTALNGAITSAEAHTLGFEDGEYAPYNNVAALTLLAEAKAVDQLANNAKDEINALTTALSSATWTANAGDVDIIYNGDFAVANGMNPKGWTRSNGAWGQQITGLSQAANDVNDGTTTAWYYNTDGAWEYGKDDVYKMPLAASTSYKLTFKYRSQDSNSNNFLKASVLNASDEGLAEVTFEKNGDKTKFVTATAYFTTGAAGNYVLSLTQSGNTHLTDVSLVKVASATLAINEGVTYAPENRTFYETVTLTRTLSDENWNTFVVPFDIDNATLTAKFGTVEVAEYSETADGDNSTINFNKMATPAITANVPVLLKTSTAPASVTFNNVLIKTNEAKVAGTNYDFVGTYAASATIAADDYFIGSNKLWKSTGATTIKGTRAYIKAKTAAARIAGFAIDGEETTAINGITISKDNAPIYNLNGQRVAKPAKGMYVKNGKKVVMK